MTNPALTACVLSALLAFGVAGCSHKTDASNANAELDKAAKLIQQPAPATAQPTPVAATSTVLPPAQQMNQAVAAYKGGNYEDAVAQLQRLRARPAMTPEQQMALQDAMGAVMTDIYARAAKGDARAQQAVKLYEQMQTAR